jgi:type I restriction enzyme M protein
MIGNFRGYDISPDMVRLSLVNMYLHGFSNPQIFEYDTLTSEERWHEYADVILANPPFMSPKGGIRPHKKFSVQSKRSEVLFVDYMAEHLTTTGRAAIIVPEGIIFQSGTAYKALRKYLVDKNYLWAVVSLPSGVFNPYAGVKTSILFLDKVLAKKSDQILFVKVENDGYDLGAQRRVIEKNDLPAALQLMQAWQQAVVEKGGQGFDVYQHSEITALLVEKSRLAENGEYALTGERYKISKTRENYRFPLVELREVCDIISGQSPEGKYYNNEGKGTPFYQGKSEFSEIYLKQPTKWTTQLTKTAYKNDILMSVRAPVGPVNIATQEICIGRGLAAIRADEERILYKYLFYLLRAKESEINGNSGAVFPSINRSEIEKIKIPLPPLEIQGEIVAEIEGYQRIIDGARMVVENWKPNIELELEEARKEAGVVEWKRVKLGEVCVIARGGSPRPINKYISKDNTGVNWIKIGDVAKGAKYIEKTKEKIIIEGTKKSRKVIIGDFVLSNSMSFGRPYIMKIEGYIHDGWLLIREDKDRVYKDYLYYVLQSKLVKDQFEKSATGGVVRNLNSELVRKVEIPLPSIQIQKEIVKNIETEWQIIDMNNRLILNYEEKIKKVIYRIWQS